MPLTVAAWQDMCLMMLQDCDYEAHISNTGKVSGKGMNFKQKTARWNKAEKDFVNSCIDAMQNGDIEQEVMFDLHPERIFVPSKTPTFNKSNPTQRSKPAKRKLAKDSNDDSDSDNNDLPMVPEAVEEQKLGYNLPHLVMLIDKVIVCSGCEIPFNRKDC